MEELKRCLTWIVVLQPVEMLLFMNGSFAVSMDPELIESRLTQEHEFLISEETGITQRILGFNVQRAHVSVKWPPWKDFFS